ncbi:hypothetical protein E2320_022491 [Naja naja]|nr:hypothetical protein E2320_022491 [Naja naja]
MTKKVNKLEEQLVQLQEDYKKRLAHEENWNGDEEKIAELQAQLAQKTTSVNDSKLKEQEFRELVRNFSREKMEKFSFSSKIHTHL